MRVGSRLVIRVLIALSASTLVSGCSSEPPIAMPAAQITRFVLDLSGSNDAVEQYARLKPTIYQELKLASVGNPYGSSKNGPVDLSMTFIVGSASQARVESILSSDFGFKLFEDIQKVYGRTGAQIAKDWPLVVAADAKAFDARFSGNQESCASEIYKTMDVNLGEEISKEIAQRLCSRAIETIDVIERQIPASITKASGSDVFGAFREIDTWVEKTKSTKPDSKIKVVFASDMVHWTNGQRDLFGKKGLLTGKIGKAEIEAVAKEQAQLSSLKLEGVSVNIIGRGNSSSVSADQGEALAIFWKSFAEASGFNLDTLTDGRA
jgi:hypothetical protein